MCLLGLKTCSLSLQIIEQLNICYELLSFILKFIETPNLTWQKLIGMEGLCSLVSNSNLLFDLYKFKLEGIEPRNKYYDDILNSLTKVSYAVITMKDKKGIVETVILIKAVSFISL
jgi:hypothetical protein